MQYKTATEWIDGEEFTFSASPDIVSATRIEIGTAQETGSESSGADMHACMLNFVSRSVAPEQKAKLATYLDDPENPTLASELFMAVFPPLTKNKVSLGKPIGLEEMEAKEA